MTLEALHASYGPLIVAGTGHRPNKLGGYEWNSIQQGILERTTEELLRLKPSLVVSGMALGFDQILACIALEHKIPLLAAVPFRGQEQAWPEDSQRYYRNILADAAEVVYVCDGGYAPNKMQRRNEWMVDNCDLLLACWDGSPGGTGNCIRYATKVGRAMTNVWA